MITASHLSVRWFVSRVGIRDSLCRSSYELTRSLEELGGDEMKVYLKDVNQILNEVGIPLYLPWPSRDPLSPLKKPSPDAHEHKVFQLDAAALS